MSEYLGEAVVHVDVRPVRAAYLIRPRSAQDLKRAIYYACGRWGGYREPIVPVSTRGRIPTGYRSLLQRIVPPDLYIDLSGLSDDVRSKVQSAQGKPVVPERLVKSESWNGWNTFHPLAAHTEDEIREIAVVMPARPWLGHRVGTVQDADERAEWEGLGAQLAFTEDAVDLAIAQLEDRTVIATTLHQYHELVIENPFVMTEIWLSRGNSVRDCLEFWNWRAATPKSGFERDYTILTTPEVFGDARFQEVLVRLSGIDRT